MGGRHERLLTGVALSGALLLSACTGGSSANSGAPCLDDSQSCISARTSALAAMQTDGSRAWINKPVNAQVHASGVRMFAYRTLKDKLSCAELNAGMNEMSSVRSALAAPVAGATKDRVIQAKMLADETHGELKKVHARKGCA